MIGHRSRFQENEDLPLRQSPVVKKKLPFSNARVLITGKILRNANWGMTLNEVTFKSYMYD